MLWCRLLSKKAESSLHLPFCSFFSIFHWLKSRGQENGVYWQVKALNPDHPFFSFSWLLLCCCGFQAWGLWETVCRDGQLQFFHLCVSAVTPIKRMELSPPHPTKAGLASVTEWGQGDVITITDLKKGQFWASMLGRKCRLFCWREKPVVGALRFCSQHHSPMGEQGLGASSPTWVPPALWRCLLSMPPPES